MRDVRLIDANALRERLLVLRCNINNNTVNCVSDIFDICLTEVSNAPVVETYTKDDMTKGYLKGYNACKDMNKRPQGAWIITAEDNEGIHRIQCPFCGYEKGSDFIDYITVTFERTPPFCENCGAGLRGKA